MAIKVSESAKKHLSELDVRGDRFLRIAVTPGGCSGMSYSVQIDTANLKGDLVVFQEDGIRVVADAGSALFIGGLSVDYSDDLVRPGFRFINPNARETCGCGASFNT